MLGVRYALGKARRMVAGNMWCAQKKNQGRLPCIDCVGRGTVGDEGPRRGCDTCGCSGHGSYHDLDFWYKAALIVLLHEKGKGSDD